MPRACSLCEGPGPSPWMICSCIEYHRGPEADPPRFVPIKRELEEAFGMDLTVTEFKRHVDEHIEISVAGACLIRAEFFDEETPWYLDEPPDGPTTELAGYLPDRPVGPEEAWTIADHPAIDALHGQPLDTLHLAVPPDDEDGLVRLWIEDGGRLLTYTLEFRGVNEFAQYSPTLDLSAGVAWELSEVRRTDDVLDPEITMSRRYQHVPPLEVANETSASNRGPTATGEADDGLEAGVQPTVAVWQGEFDETSWTPTTPMSDLSTDEIVRQLQVFGIDNTVAGFRGEINAVASPAELLDHWEEVYPISATGFEEDFVWMAAEELWKRLGREGPSTPE